MGYKCQRFLVSGTVQGVFFRQSTLEKANELKNIGWVRNLSDGRVEVVCCGEEKDVHALARWLWEGPPGARVSSVRAEQMDETDVHCDDFHIRY